MGMTFKTAMNLSTIMITVITLLATFSTWALNGIYTQAEAQFKELKEHKMETQSRLDVLETQNAERWDRVLKELERINATLEKRR